MSMLAAQARRFAQRAHTRQSLVDAARRTVAQHGFSAVSIADIARAAGIATGAPYRHFSSKTALLVEVFRQTAGREVEVMRAIGQSEGPAAARLRQALATFCERALRSGRMAWALLAEPLAPEIEAERLILRRAYAQVIGDIVRDGIARGEFPPQDVDTTAACIVGALGEGLLRPLWSHEAGPPDAAIDFCLRATSAPEPPR
jgi:AcrR family transcriptional regulator